MAIGGARDEVITPAFSYIATAEVTALLGAKLVYVDVDPISFNIDFNKIANISHRTKAIIVSLYGQPADFDEINYIGQNTNTCHRRCGKSFGSEYKTEIL